MPATFQEIFSSYWPKVFRLCMGYVNDRDWAKDIAQETFITVWQQLPKFRNESSIGTWIFRIASNHCLRQIERHKRRDIAALPETVVEPVDQDVEYHVELLYRSIAELPEIDRLIIGLELEELKQAEIAMIVGITEANVRVRIHRIKEKIKQKVKQYEQES
jgi:RNA polymerase sigma-70 factor, ECF subfamily